MGILTLLMGLRFFCYSVYSEPGWITTAEDKKKSIRGGGFVASFSVLVVWYVFYVICWYGLKVNS